MAVTVSVWLVIDVRVLFNIDSLSFWIIIPWQNYVQQNISN